jgi:hypothetical protein
MKKFFFALLVGLLFGGLLYVQQYCPEQIPESINAVSQKIVSKWDIFYNASHQMVAEHGLHVSFGIYGKVIISALVVFFSLWMSLAVLLGFRGFFRDFFSFFPLRK